MCISNYRSLSVELSCLQLLARKCCDTTGKLTLRLSRRSKLPLSWHVQNIRSISQIIEVCHFNCPRLLLVNAVTRKLTSRLTRRRKLPLSLLAYPKYWPISQIRRARSYSLSRTLSTASGRTQMEREFLGRGGDGIRMCCRCV